MAKVVAELQANLTLKTQSFTLALTNAKKSMSEFREHIVKENGNIRRSFSTLKSNMGELDNSMSESIINIASLYMDLNKQVLEFERNARSSARGLATSFLDVAEAIELIQSSTNSSFSNLREMLTETKTLASKTTDSIRRSNEAMKQQAINELRDFNKVINTQGNAMARSFSKVTQSITGIKKASNKTTASLNKNLKTTDRLASGVATRLNAVSKNMVASGKAIRSIQMPKGMNNSSGRANKNTSSSIRQTVNEVGALGAQSDATTKKMVKNNSKISKSFQDIGKIVSGMVISQVFYKTANIVQNMTTSMWEMGSAIETTEASFGIMLRDFDLGGQLAKEVIDYANESAFSFESAAGAARQLLAYGFQMKDIMPMLRTIGDSSAAMGNSEAFERISRALGLVLIFGPV